MMYFTKHVFHSRLFSKVRWASCKMGNEGGNEITNPQRRKLVRKPEVVCIETGSITTRDRETNEITSVMERKIHRYERQRMQIQMMSYVLTLMPSSHSVPMFSGQVFSPWPQKEEHFCFSSAVWPVHPSVRINTTTVMASSPNACMLLLCQFL